MSSSVQAPWSLPIGDPDEAKRVLALNLPQLLSPLAKSPVTPAPLANIRSPLADSGPMPEWTLPSGSSDMMNRVKPPLSNVPADTRLAVTPQQPRPLSEEDITTLRTPPKPEDYATTGWRKGLGLALAGIAGTAARDPNVAAATAQEVLQGPYRRAQEQWKQKIGAIEEPYNVQKKIADIQEVQQRGTQTKENLIQDSEGNVVGWKDQRGNVRSLNDPQTPQGIKDIATTAENKEAKPTFEKDPVSGNIVKLTTDKSGKTTSEVVYQGSQKPDNSIQNKERFQSIVGKVKDAGLGTGPSELTKSLDAAAKRGSITRQDSDFASGYLAANPTPSNTVIVQAAGAQSKEDIKDANTYYRWVDPQSGRIVTGKGKEKPAGVTADPIGSDKEYAQHRREANAANIVQDSINRVAKDIDENPGIFDNGAARAVLATATDDAKAQSIGLLVMGTGGQIRMPSGASKVIDTLLENNAVPKNLRRAVKDYIADYWAMKDKAVVQQMEMQGGKIGRGSQAVFESIVAQLPGGATADSEMARRQIANLQQTQDRLNSQYADDGKTKPYQMKQSGGQQPTSGTQAGERPVYQKGKLIGYTQDGKTISRTP